MTIGQPPTPTHYQILALSKDGARPVLMTGMTLEQAEAAREEIVQTKEYLWVWIERDPPAASA